MNEVPVPSDLDRSRAICRVCGASQVLSAELVQVTEELSTFSARHGEHDEFRIDVVVAGQDELPHPDRPQLINSDRTSIAPLGRDL